MEARQHGCACTRINGREKYDLKITYFGLLLGE
jgi:hypothetical protein